MWQREKWEAANNVLWVQDTQNAPVKFGMCNPPVTAIELPAAHCLKYCHCHCAIAVLPVHSFAQSFYFLFCCTQRDGEALDVPELHFTTLFPKIQDFLRNICYCLRFPGSSRENCLILHTSSRERRKKKDISSLSSFFSTAWKKFNWDG